MLGDWLRDPRVMPWWRDAAKQLVGIEEDLREPAMDQWIALIDGQPVGYAQAYPAHHWRAPHFADLPADTIAIDVFSAPEGFGSGSQWLAALAKRLLRDASVLVIDPAPDNLRAIRAYQKAGFAGEKLLADETGQVARVMTRLR